MKKTKFLTAILAAAMLTATLTACGNETEDNAVTPEEPETVTESGETDETVDTPVANGYNDYNQDLEGEFVVDVEGVKFDLAVAKELNNQYGEEGGELTPEEALEKHNSDEFYHASWDFALFQPSMGVGYNSIDNPDFVDAETFELSVELPENTNGLVQVREGDVISGLTAKNVEFSYTYYTPSGWGDFTFSSNIDFDGEIVLSGYIGAAEDEGEFYVSAGDIFFYPDPSFAEILPLSQTLFGQSLESDFQWLGDFYVYTDVPRIRLGTLYDEEYNDVDISAIPNDGTMKHAEVKLTDINAHYNVNFGLRVTAKIVEIN